MLLSSPDMGRSIFMVTSLEKDCELKRRGYSKRATPGSPLTPRCEDVCCEAGKAAGNEIDKSHNLRGESYERGKRGNRILL